MEVLYNENVVLKDKINVLLNENNQLKAEIEIPTIDFTRGYKTPTLLSLKCSILNLQGCKLFFHSFVNNRFLMCFFV